MTEPLCLLTVHAHPDDEASKGAGTVAKLHDEGVRTVLVTCTGGEEGDILNPAMDRPEVRERLHEVRRDELDRAAKIIGYDEVVLLPYRDSGMPDSEANKRPDAFANAPLDEAVGKLVEVIRRERPQVIITYNDDQTGYPHPDHLMVHDISGPAFERAGDPYWEPHLGEPWTPAKLYYTVWSRQRVLALHDKMTELGVESPFTKEWFERPSQDHRITTSVDVNGYYHVRRDALLAHATQVDPKSPFWFGLPDEVMETIHPFDEYVLASSRVESVPPETDVFAGLR
jgi:mycothiol S-conjugate amidase